MNGNQCHVEVCVEDTVFRPFATQKELQNGKRLVGPCELQAEENRHHHANHAHHNTCDEELTADHFVIGAEDILTDEAFVVMLVGIHVYAVCCCCTHLVYAFSWSFN